MARQCPGNALFCTDQAETAETQPQAGVMQAGVIEGRYVKGIVLDTGCSRTLVKKTLIDDKKMLEGKTVSVRCAHGDTVTYPLARVTMAIKGHTIEVIAGVAEALPAPTLLGTDVPELAVLLEGRALGPQTGDEEEQDGLLTMTRSQARKLPGG